jgi:hypothetical protein
MPSITSRLRTLRAATVLRAQWVHLWLKNICAASEQVWIVDSWSKIHELIT